LNDAQAIATKATASIKWSALSGVIQYVAPPLTFLALARLLSPHAFGVLSTAMIFITFSQMFWEAGLGRALIQIQIAAERAANVVFWMNTVLGLVTYALFLVGAPLAADFFKCPQCASVLRVLGLQAVILAFTSVQQNLYMRDFDFRGLFLARLIASVMPALVAIPMAILGMGVWSLVAGTLAGSLFFMLALWGKSDWRPQCHFETDVARRLAKFGAWVVLESFGAWLIIWGDSVLLGRYLGMEQLGIYRVAWTVSLVVFGLLVTPLTQVAFPAFSRLGDSSRHLKDAFTSAAKTISCVSLPSGVGLLILSPEISDVVFGNKWAGLGLIMGIIGILNGVAFTLYINRELYTAIGRPDLNVKVLIISLMFYLPAYLIAAPMGLNVFVYTRLALSLLALPIHVFICTRLLDLSAFYWFRWNWSAITASMVMACTLWVLKFSAAEWSSAIPGWAFLGCLVIAGAVSYIIALFAVDASLASQMWQIGKRALVS
jgi:PST family polysaccharide transporter